MKKKFYAVLFTALTLCATACSDKDDKTEQPVDPNNPENPVNPTDPTDPIAPSQPVEGVLSPEDSKQYLESTALAFMNKFNPADQQAAIDSYNYAIDRYGDLDAPYDFDDDDDYYWSPARVAEGLRAFLRSGDAGHLSRAYEDLYEFSDFTGVYEPGRDSWVLVSDSEDVVFRFPGTNGMCELKAVAEGNEWSGDWNYDGDNYAVKVPAKITLTYTDNGTQLANIVVETTYNKSASTVKVRLNAKVANIAATLNLDGNSSQLAETQTLSVGGQVIQTSEAQVRGYNLLDYQAALDESYNLYGHLTAGTASVDVLGNVQVKGTITDFGNLRGISDYYSSYEYGSSNRAESECRSTCEKLNSCVDARVYYAGTTYEQGNLKFAPKQDYQSWEVEPLIVFAADGSSQSFGAYFDSGFSGVESRFTTLINSYKRLLK